MQYFETMNAIEETVLYPFESQRSFCSLPECIQESTLAILASNDMLKQGGEMRDHLNHNMQFIGDSTIEDVTFTLSNVMDESLTFTEEVLHEVLDTYHSMIRIVTGRLS